MASERRYDFKKARDELSSRAKDVAEKLSLNAPRKSGKFWFINPARYSDATTLWVNVEDGSWRHEGQNAGPGDVIALIGHCLGRTPLDSVIWAYEFLGWKTGNSVTAKPLSDAEILERDAKARRDAEARADAREKKSRGNVWFWSKRLLPGEGTLAEAYLRGRLGSSFDLLGHMPSALKFQTFVPGDDPAKPLLKMAEHTDPETGEVTEWPAMIALAVGDQGQACLHRTLLDPAGWTDKEKGKAPLRDSKGKSIAKAIFGPQQGSMIRLTRGKGNYKPAYAVAHGHTCPLIIGEGIETTLKVAAYLPEARAWAAMTLGNMRSILWPEHASTIILLKDNDTHAMALSGFDKVHAHWLEQAALKPGRSVIVEHSDTGSDFADE